jgi:hypothetical protein
MSGPSRADIEYVRERVRQRGTRPEAFMYAEVAKVIERVGGDLELAIDALCMKPLPTWIENEVMKS